MEIFGFAFFRNALIGLMLVSIASAIVGTYVVTRRLMFVTGGMVSWGVIGIGAEYRFGNCNYRNLVGDSTLVGNLDKSGFRAFITLRFK